MNPGVDFCRKFIGYDPETGNVFRTCDRGKGRAGDIFSSLDTRGYIRVSVDGRRVRGHRVAWALHHGEWPADNMDIDHINGVRTDNRIENLRLATRSQNHANRHNRRVNSTGVRWAYYYPDCNRYAARIKIFGKVRHVGMFDTAQEAHEAARKVHVEAFGEYANSVEGVIK